MRQRWGKFRQLPARDRALLLAALLMLPIVRVSLRLFGFRRLCRILIWTTPPFRDQVGSNHSAAADLERARASALCVSRAATHGLYRANCLDQSVALWWLLRLQGVVTEIRIGVRRSDQFEAHAWVEFNSVVVNDREDVSNVFESFARSVIDIPGQPNLPLTHRASQGDPT